MAVLIDEETIQSLPITIDPEILGGTPVFVGTRVPVEALLDNVAAGVTVDDFLDNFPSVTHEQVLAVLAFSNQTLKRLGQTN